MSPRSGTAVVEIDLPSRVELVTVVRMIVVAACEIAEGLDAERLDDLRVATSEATTNAIQANELRDGGSGESGGESRVRVRCEVAPGSVKLTVSDEGLGMPAAPPVPEITHPDRLLIEGGFGVPLMKLLSDGLVHFSSTDLGTTVELELRQ